MAATIDLSSMNDAQRRIAQTLDKPSVCRRQALDLEKPLRSPRESLGRLPLDRVLMESLI